MKNYQITITNVDLAILTLRQNGYTALPYQTGILVKAFESNKLELIKILTAASIIIYDLEEI